MIVFPKFKNYDGQYVKYIQPKMDGHLVKIIRGTNRLNILTKNNKDITKKVWDIDSLREMLENGSPHSIMFGEMHSPGIKATSVPTLLNNKDKRLKITVFAAPLLRAKNLFNTDLKDIMAHLHHCGVESTDTSIIDPERSISEGCCGLLLQEATEKKLEGWVLKQGHMEGWFKLKPTKTVDAFVIGTSTSFSDTQYGGLKSISVAVWDSGVLCDLGTVGGGFELDFRMEVDKESLIDKVAEIEYDSVAAKGRLRFPRFIRWREDKDKKDCTIDQLEI